jgi:hypothetical protein
MRPLPRRLRHLHRHALLQLSIRIHLVQFDQPMHSDLPADQFLLNHIIISITLTWVAICGAVDGRGSGY